MDLHSEKRIPNNFSGWWLNQPIWNIFLDRHFSIMKPKKVGVKIPKMFETATTQKLFLSCCKSVNVWNSEHRWRTSTESRSDMEKKNISLGSDRILPGSLAAVCAWKFAGPQKESNPHFASFLRGELLNFGGVSPWYVLNGEYMATNSSQKWREHETCFTNLDVFERNWGNYHPSLQEGPLADRYKWSYGAPINGRKKNW